MAAADGAGESSVCVKLRGRGEHWRRPAKKGKKAAAAAPGGKGGGFSIDKQGRRHPTGEAWHLQRQAAQTARAEAAPAVAAEGGGGVSTRARINPLVHRLACKASVASEAEHAQVVRQRQHRREVLALEEQVGNMQRLLDDTQRQMAGLQNHILRMRQKEAAALDTKKEAELLAAEKMRRAEELRLQVVAAQAGREAAEARAVAEREEREKVVAMAHKKELDRANKALQLE